MSKDNFMKEYDLTGCGLYSEEMREAIKAAGGAYESEDSIIANLCLYKWHKNAAISYARGVVDEIDAEREEGDGDAKYIKRMTKLFDKALAELG